MGTHVPINQSIYFYVDIVKMAKPGANGLYGEAVLTSRLNSSLEAT